MCGIVGQFSKKDGINEKIAKKMLASINHRGPDDSGFYREDKMFLGHNRLSILDLSEAGHQPMWNSDNTIGIIFNGEIYNFKEIKKELVEFKFKSRTDTEVIICAYQKWGLKKTLEKFNGMFSFCIYDKKKNKAFFARDRMGIKPFVYYWDNNNFIFSSELKAILCSNLIKKEINKKAVLDFFIYRYVPSPRTIFENIYKLDPGNFLELDLEKFELKKECYWKLKNKRDIDMKEEKIEEEIEKLIKDSVDLRLISDIEVATFLSGGIDSSLITSLAKEVNPKIRAFTIDICPKKYSEANYARSFAQAKNIKNKISKVGQKEFEDNFDKIIKFYDEPFADSSLVPTYLLCKLVKDSNIKCVLSGDGGDEVFYGYKWYGHFNKLESRKFLEKILPKNILLFISKIPNFKLISFLFLESLERYRRIMFDRFSVGEINELFSFNFLESEDYMFKEKIGKETVKKEELNYLDFHTFMVDDILYKVDIASMANSVEVRVPFLDHRLVEFVFAILFKYLYKNNELKHLLKQVAKKHIPKENVYREKKGFSAPVIQWIGKDFKKALLSGSLVKHGFIDSNKMKLFLERESNESKVWQMYIFEKWFSNYMAV